MGCPKCEGREGSYLESYCEAHFEELPTLSEEKVRKLLEEGRKLSEATAKSFRSMCRVDPEDRLWDLERRVSAIEKWMRERKR